MQTSLFKLLISLSIIAMFSTTSNALDGPAENYGEKIDKTNEATIEKLEEMKEKLEDKVDKIEENTEEYLENEEDKIGDTSDQ